MSESDVRVDRAADHRRYVATDDLVWFQEPDDLAPFCVKTLAGAGS